MEPIVENLSITEILSIITQILRAANTLQNKTKKDAIINIIKRINVENDLWFGHHDEDRLEEDKLADEDVLALEKFHNEFKKELHIEL